MLKSVHNARNTSKNDLNIWKATKAWSRQESQTHKN